MHCSMFNLVIFKKKKTTVCLLYLCCFCCQQNVLLLNVCLMIVSIEVCVFSVVEVYVYDTALLLDEMHEGASNTNCMSKTLTNVLAW